MISIDDFIENQSRLIESYPDSKRIQWLKNQSWYNQEHEKINNRLKAIVPNTHIVTTPHEHVPIDLILSQGQVFTIPSILFSFENSRCHDNCDKLYLHKEIANVCTGYALSSDGLWRYHSWGLDYDDVIIETTSERILYFGVPVYKTREKIN